MIALAHLISPCSTSVPSVESCIPGNVCPVPFPLTPLSFKGEQYSFSRKVLCLWGIQIFIIFDLKLSLPPPNILLTANSKKWFQADVREGLILNSHYPGYTASGRVGTCLWAHWHKRKISGLAQQNSELKSPCKKSHRWLVNAFKDLKSPVRASKVAQQVKALAVNLATRIWSLRGVEMWLRN